MGLSESDGWFAVFLWENSQTDTHLIPIIAWETRCVDGNDSLVGFVVQDRDGSDLPFPVAAPDVFGFVRYLKTRR